MTARLLSIDDLAEMLQISPQTIYRWRYLGTGPVGVRIGKHVRYRVQDVEAWLDERADAAR